MAPRLVADQPGVYIRVFALAMLLCDLLTVLVIALWSAATGGAAAVPRRLAWYTAYVAVLSTLAYTRFDLVPTLLAFAAAIAWDSERPAVGALASALGALTKLFPGCVAAVGFVHEFIHQKSTRMRGTVVFAVAVLVLTALSWTFGGHALFSSYLDRKLQLESTFAGILMVVGRLGGLPMTLEDTHHSLELGMGGTRLLVALTLPLQGVLFCVALYAVWRSRGADFLRHPVAAMLALIVPAKLLSPQYLIWLIPFVSVLEDGAAPRIRWLFLAACVATSVISLRYPDLYHFQWWAIGVLNLRNALLFVLFLILVRGRTIHRTTTGDQMMACAGRPTAIGTSAAQMSTGG